MRPRVRHKACLRPRSRLEASVVARHAPFEMGQANAALSRYVNSVGTDWISLVRALEHPAELHTMLSPVS